MQKRGEKMEILKTILGIIVFSAVVLIAFNFMKTHVFQKVKINKWLILAVAIAIFLIPMFIWPNMPLYVANYVIPAIFVLLLLWFLDLSGFMQPKNSTKSGSKKGSKTGAKPKIVRADTKKDKKKDVVIRPKAKPNRVKNNQK